MIAQRSPRGYLRIVRSQSGRQDSNLRPSAPKAPSTQFATDPKETSEAITYEFVLQGFV